MTKTLLEMSNLQQVARNEQIQLIPMIEEIFTDLAPLAEKRGVTLKAEGDGIMTGSDALIYRLIFNLTENAVKYNRPGGAVWVYVTQETEKVLIRVSDTGRGIPEEYQRSIFQPFFRVDKSRSREYGGVGLGLSLVWEIADLQKLFRHDGECTAHRTDRARARVQRIDKRAGQNAKHQAGQHLFRNEGQANGNDRRQDAKKSYLYRFHENDSLLTIPGAAAPWFVRRYHTTPHPEWGRLKAAQTAGGDQICSK